jgi:hypothetical protein
MFAAQALPQDKGILRADGRNQRYGGQKPGDQRGKHGRSFLVLALTYGAISGSIQIIFLMMDKKKSCLIRPSLPP